MSGDGFSVVCQRCLGAVGSVIGRLGLGGTATRFELDQGACFRGRWGTTARGKNEEADARRGVGRSRGGLNSKVQAAVDACGRLACLKVTPGQTGDGPVGRELLGQFEPGQIGHVLADTAYDGDETRAEIKRLKSKACIKPHPNRTTQKRYDKARYQHRN